MSGPVTFNPSLLTALDRLRFQLGDTDTTAPLLVDATYDAMLATSGNDERVATIALADALVVRFAQEATRKSITNVDGAGELEWKDRLSAWRELAARLRGELASVAAGQRGSFGVSLAQRAGADGGGEYYAGGRCADALDRSW